MSEHNSWVLMLILTVTEYCLNNEEYEGDDV